MDCRNPAQSAAQSKIPNMDCRNPEQIERDLKKIFDESNWGKYHHYLVLFGRYHCTARKPNCEACPILKYCKKHNKTD